MLYLVFIKVHGNKKFKHLNKFCLFKKMTIYVEVLNKFVNNHYQNQNCNTLSKQTF